MCSTARLKRGETLLVQGGSSGIGVTAIQLAKAMGATVIVTAGSDDKCAACLTLGADHAINYKTQDFEAEAKRLTDGRGVDVVLDMVAGDYVAREIECLAEDGRIVIIAVQGGTKSEFNVGAVLRKRLTIIGSTLRPRSHRLQAGDCARLREQVWPLIEAGQIKPVIHTRVRGAAGGAGAHADGIEPACGQDRPELEGSMSGGTRDAVASRGVANAAVGSTEVIDECKTQADRRQLEDARQPPGNAELLAGILAARPFVADVAVCVPFPYLSEHGGSAGGQRHPLGRAGLLAARAGRLHR